ncbi:hypothetical protein JCM3774_000785 [Rhodotorula dairenensis]
MDLDTCRSWIRTSLFNMIMFAFALLAASIVGPDGQISAVNAHSKLREYGQADLKEMCFRNLYADLAAFKIKHSQEVLISDSKGGTAFLSQGVLRTEDDVEMLYEEWCYKKYKIDQHKSDVQALSGIQVGKRDLISSLGLSSLDAFKGFSSVEKGNAHEDSSPLYAKGTFLDSFATYSPAQDDGFFSGTGSNSLEDDSLDTGAVDGTGRKGEEGKVDKTGAGGESPKVADLHQPEVSYSVGQGEAKTEDGKGKRAWAWRRFVVRSGKASSPTSA